MRNEYDYMSIEEETAPEVAAPTAPSDEQILAFVQANIDNPALIAETAAQYGVSLNDISRATNFSPAAVTSYFETANVEPPAKVAEASPVVQSGSVSDAVQNSVQNAIQDTSSEAPAAKASVATTTATQSAPVSQVDKITQQILGQGVSDKWKGEGKGSAQNNANDMAKILTGIGITDIKDFGKITKTVDAAVQPVYGKGDLMTDDEGQQYYSQKIIGYVDQDGKPVDSSLVKTGFNPGDEGGGGGTTYTAFVGKQEVFGNKKTGQEVPSTYGERQNGNAFGGTFDGKGNTGYRVQFTDSGMPIFYTTEASSNDLKILMDDLGIVGQIALAVATGGLSIPEQIAAKFAISALSGDDISKSIKNAALSYAGSFIPGTDFMQDTTNYLNTIDSSGILSKAFTGSAVSATKAVISGDNILDAVVSGAISGGTSGVTSTLLGNIDGFSDLTTSQQNIITKLVTSTLSGQDLNTTFLNTVIDSATSAVNQTLVTGLTSVTGTNDSDIDTTAITNAFNNTLNTTSGDGTSILDTVLGTTGDTTSTTTGATTGDTTTGSTGSTTTGTTTGSTTTDTTGVTDTTSATDTTGLIDTATGATTTGVTSNAATSGDSSFDTVDVEKPLIGASTTSTTTGNDDVNLINNIMSTSGTSGVEDLIASTPDTSAVVTEMPEVDTGEEIVTTGPPTSGLPTTKTTTDSPVVTTDAGGLNILSEDETDDLIRTSGNTQTGLVEEGTAGATQLAKTITGALAPRVKGALAKALKPTVKISAPRIPKMPSGLTQVATTRQLPAQLQAMKMPAKKFDISQLRPAALPKAPPKKVDVSTLTPLANISGLTSLIQKPTGKG